MKKLKLVSLKFKINQVLDRIPGNRLWGKDIFNEAIYMHCIADKYSPEESILYAVLFRMDLADSYRSAAWFGFSNTTPPYAESFEHWKYYLNEWRNKGSVRREMYNEFASMLERVEHRWPELHSGEKPKIQQVWEVYFENHTNEAPVKLCTEYHKATEYISQNSSSDMWWHSCHLLDLSKHLRLHKKEFIFPEWSHNSPPTQFPEKNWKRDWENDPFYDFQQEKILFAMPKRTYDDWIKQAKLGNGSEYLFDEHGNERCQLVYRDSWRIYFQEYDMPIDSVDPKSHFRWHNQDQLFSD